VLGVEQSATAHGNRQSQEGRENRGSGTDEPVA